MVEGCGSGGVLGHCGQSSVSTLERWANNEIQVVLLPNTDLTRNHVSRQNQLYHCTNQRVIRYGKVDTPIEQGLPSFQRLLRHSLMPHRRESRMSLS